MSSGLLLECKVEVQERESDMKVRFEFPCGRVVVIEGDDIARAEVIGTADDLTASVSRARVPTERPRIELLRDGVRYFTIPTVDGASATDPKERSKPTTWTGESPTPPPTWTGESPTPPQHELEPLDSSVDESPTVVS